MRTGVHVGLQATTMPDLKEVWEHAEAIGVDWISGWDHLASSGTPGWHSYEAVAAHAALAAATERATVGTLVYCVPFRHPVVLAKAAVTIDHISGGRAAIGLGAGWSRREFAAYGFPFGTLADRYALVRSTARALRALFAGTAVTSHDANLSLVDARCEPLPLQERLPIWIGGGTQAAIDIAADHGDGWNVAWASPDELARGRGALIEALAARARPRVEVPISVNVALAADRVHLDAQFGPMATGIAESALIGPTEVMAEKLVRYVEAGADQVNVAIRAPWDLALLERFAEAAACLGGEVGQRGS